MTKLANCEEHCLSANSSFCCVRPATWPCKVEVSSYKARNAQSLAEREGLTGWVAFSQLIPPRNSWVLQEPLGWVDGIIQEVACKQPCATIDKIEHNSVTSVPLALVSPWARGSSYPRSTRWTRTTTGTSRALKLGRRWSNWSGRGSLQLPGKCSTVGTGFWVKLAIG